MDQTSYHYAVMRRAIDLIDRAEAPMSLEDLAGAMSMSPAHFQRLFSAWAGVSPKRYQQYLALGHAKALLRERRAVLEVADAVGLSGPSRLHDLFVRWEAMTPGSFAREGEGLTIRMGLFETPFGPAVAMGTEHGLCGLGFTAEQGEAAVRADLRARWPRADFVEEPDALRPWVEAAFGGEGARLHLIGAPFQIKVWEALLAIPSGQVVTYGEIAQVIGAPRAVRAVGTAVGRNPVSWLIPCHRALRTTGALGGYHWGLPVKRAMLAWESARAEAREPERGAA
ncbi:ADA regulatory protein / Methylated-DNA--protein-cysteine methyltransferase [Rubellimicrobium mesophilum DSM 19309]|uniref:methylated-DNA--[protein]-cysteine S-methyltransferase n=1 Tax=Rubellimicrobium mesophilum DSM 19309 TaxID=442562 RepID=A0A017HUZ2_9RHOB|nr:bifunctional helix-turn-helix domain-containing protein/methylated-DNA--[protein]-cysteine S-methyltransferase [Rubellimicrobium mesophilum]EYD77973.1 ADA regulatory protein / Methylated-DNA--protein-cysteine methyltransferase [Rubellimicrobium mesophilum DSM 19309]